MGAKPKPSQACMARQWASCCTPTRARVHARAPARSHARRQDELTKRVGALSAENKSLGAQLAQAQADKDDTFRALQAAEGVARWAAAVWCVVCVELCSPMLRAARAEWGCAQAAGAAACGQDWGWQCSAAAGLLLLLWVARRHADAQR